MAPRGRGTAFGTPLGRVLTVYCGGADRDGGEAGRDGEGGGGKDEESGSPGEAERVDDHSGGSGAGVGWEAGGGGCSDAGAKGSGGYGLDQAEDLGHIIIDWSPS